MDVSDNHSSFFTKNILVTGSNGQLGSEIRKIAPEFPDFNFQFTSREDLPLEDTESIRRIFEEQQYHYCINCAAYTAVDKAEENQDEAFLINAASVENLAIICHEHQTKLIHISTDYVFNGKSKKPLKEEDGVSPLNIYGRSKLRGEELLLNKNPNALILRTSWVYSSFGNNFVKTIFRLCKEGKKLNVINDQFGCPTYAVNIAAVIIHLILHTENNENPIGILHYCDKGVTNWYDFARAIKNYSACRCEITPVTTAQYKTAAKRPQYSILDSSKIQKLLELQIPSWQQSLKKCLNILQ